MKKLDVVYVTPHPPELSETFVANEISELNGIARLNLTVIPLRPIAGDVRAAVRAIAEGSPSLLSREPAIGELIPKAKAVGFAKAVRRKTDGRPVVFHSPFINEPATVACILAKRFRCVATSSAHAADFQLQARRSLRWNLEHLDFGFPVSSAAALALETVLPTFSAKMAIVRASVVAAISEMTRTNNESGTVGIVVVARLVEKKGIDQGIRLVRLLIDAGHNVKLEIVGDGPERLALEQLASSLGLDSCIRFRGSLKHSQAIDILRSADLALLPARRAASGDEDGIPIFLMEAALLGVPFVSTRVGGIPELVPPGVTVLAADEDARSLAHVVIPLLTEPELARATGLALQAHAQSEFDPAKQAERMVSIWETLIS